MVGWGTGLHSRFTIENTDEGGQDERVKDRAELASSPQHRNSELGMQGCNAARSQTGGL